MIINAVIIDDEVNNVDNLSILLQQYCKQVHVVAKGFNAQQGKDIILQYKPDLVFLDVQMPGEDGFELLKSLPDLYFEIIFVTAYDQYGIQAIKFSAIDYLLKPIKIHDLQDAVNKVVIKNSQKKQNLQLENLVKLLQQNEPPRIAISTTKETRFIKPDNIIFCESSNNYTTFHLNNSETIISSRPIYEYESLLGPYGFIRCHQSYIINKNHVKSWVKEDGGYLLMEDNSQIPVSRNKKENLRDLLR
ncbi:DNA-binding response regulator [Niastella koreensis]|uniref:Two component transcriptional regulator, LytTR family n=2 Tax=Niastella koreensis TaxID=354356 RepID=G8TE50_NIAKG|nr:LytTR family DNA-binding domain-containing protein [Niastella koreensis]AEV97241.1 two component transcriptional regulator, LytTR family [Niastella koreensis GR20-10]OQP39082.1 DNA-binding response regulator [Niastella koreensis]